MRGEEIVGDPLNGFPILDRRLRSSVHLQSPSLKLFGITTDFQVAEQVLAAALAALGPVVIGTAIPAPDPVRPGGQPSQLL